MRLVPLCFTPCPFCASALLPDFSRDEIPPYAGKSPCAHGRDPSDTSWHQSFGWSFSYSNGQRCPRRVPASISVTQAAQIHHCPQLNCHTAQQGPAVVGNPSTHSVSGIGLFSSHTFTAGAGKIWGPEIPKGKTPSQETSGFYLYVFASRVPFSGLTQTPFNTNTK